MEWNALEFNNKLQAETARFNKVVANELCESLIDYLWNTDEQYGLKEAADTLQLLRNKRMFSLMRRVGDAFLQTGNTSFRLRRLYAQSLIDLSELTAALSALQGIIDEFTGNSVDLSASDSSELIEVRGLVGRVHKQIYIDNGNRRTIHRTEHLRQAVVAYNDVYTLAPTEHLWHGINVVALLDRGSRDGIELVGFPDPLALAASILTHIETKPTASTWDYATAIESCIAQGNEQAAITWLLRYVSAPGADAFELASTLRQFTEVWQLDMQSGIGQWILPTLRASLLKQEGGRVDLPSRDILPLELSTDVQEYEKIFGADSYRSLQWFQTGLQRCQLVARLGRDKTQGCGTGFLLAGSDLALQYGDELVLLTNAHVVSNNSIVRKAFGALSPEETVVTFEAHGTEEYEVAEVLWTSSPEQLDATVLRLKDGEVLLSKVTGKLAKIAKTLPIVDDKARVYIIGHPRGGGLSYSLQDNLLLDHESPRIHYRTPTAGGSSGSPVFNAKWDLIGIHHAGSATKQRLNGQSGTYQANEGIWLQAIIAAISSDHQLNFS